MKQPNVHIFFHFNIIPFAPKFDTGIFNSYASVTFPRVPHVQIVHNHILISKLTELTKTDESEVVKCELRDSDGGLPPGHAEPSYSSSVTPPRAAQRRANSIWQRLSECETCA